MAIATDIMERLLVELCRFLIEAEDVRREEAPHRSAETAAYDLACANAAVATLRHAITTRDREKARHPLREVAARLNIVLDEADPDWRRLAFRALRVMLDAEQENLRRDHGIFEEPSAAFRTARTLLETGNILIQPVALPTHSAPVAPRAMPATPCSTPVPTSAPLPTVAEPTLAQPVPAETAFAKPTAVVAAPEVAQVKSTCPDIRTGAGLYIELRSEGYRTFKPTEQVNKKSGESWARNSAPNVRSTAALFSRILDNKPFDQVSDGEMTAAWEIVARLPRSYQAKTSKMSPQEAADDADATEKHNAEITRAKMKKQGASPGNIEYEILKGRIRRLRTGTIYRHMQDFQRICKFLVKKGHLSRNIMEGHIWDSDECDRRETLEEDNERLTWFGKLDGLFRTPIFQNKLEDVGDPMFWAPLIALHMGLRIPGFADSHSNGTRTVIPGCADKVRAGC
ncbi:MULTISPECIES: hypothetical protein [unclassified Marinovum]|uniref:hypothetical protein n=1 Tax=unclassified Marinovum TaxID=2647166 RepID=UPI003EDC11C3